MKVFVEVTPDNIPDYLKDLTVDRCMQASETTAGIESVSANIESVSEAWCVSLDQIFAEYGFLINESKRLLGAVACTLVCKTTTSKSAQRGLKSAGSRRRKPMTSLFPTS